MPQNPSWVTDSIQDWVGRIGSFADADPNSFVAPASPLQQQAWGNVGQLDGWKNQMGTASNLAFNAANAGANLRGAPATYGASRLGAAAQADAPQGSQFMSQYMNPYMRDVVDTSLADFDQNAGQTRAAQAAQAARSGAFGGSRYGIAQGQTEGELARARASLDAGLRSQGFNTAAGLGMGDADRSGQIGLANTGAQNQFALTQGGMDTDAARYAADASNQQAQFNAGQQDNALQRALGGAGQLAGMADTYGAGTRADLGLMSGLGDQQRQIEQAYSMAPMAQLEMFGNLLGSTPFGLFQGQNINTTGTQNGTTTQTQSPSLFSSLLGAASTGASVASLF